MSFSTPVSSSASTSTPGNTDANHTPQQLFDDNRIAYSYGSKGNISWCCWNDSKGEDCFVVSDSVSDKCEAHVFDGHGGRDFVRAIAGEFEKRDGQGGENVVKLYSEINEKGRDIARVRNKGGTTVVSIFVEYSSEGKKIITVANAGDSACYGIKREGGYVLLTKPHKATSLDEINRVGKENIEFDRLDGCLMVTRGVGDYEFERNGMICEPHVVSFKDDGDDWKGFVLGSDGVFDFISVNDEQFSIKGSNIEGAELAKLFVEMASTGGSNDDKTVVVVST